MSETTEHTPTTAQVRAEYDRSLHQTHRMLTSRYGHLIDGSGQSLQLPERDYGVEFDSWFAAQLATAKADAWDEGHKACRSRGRSKCNCGAWNAGECACGLYGTGELVSLKDNPYRTKASE